MRNLISGVSLAVMMALGAGAAQAQSDVSGQSGSPATGSAHQVDPPTAASSAAGTPTSSAGARSPALDEKQALGVLAAINTAEVNAGNLALQKQVKGPVRDYASQMIKEHSDNNAKIAPWSPDRSAAPAEKQTKKAQAEAKKLQQLDGDTFAQAYVAAMVKDHQEALKMLDSALIPAAKTPQVAEHLRTTRTHVAAHLAKAQQLQGAVAAASAGTDAH
ncbi:putative membrane protein [Xanthomonas translucens]